MTWLYSKITPPLTAPQAVERDRLVNSLQFTNLKKLTIVRAPAGYGKTTLLSQSISSLIEPVAWVSLDHNDNSPTRYWNYVMLAVLNAVKNDKDYKEQTHFVTDSSLELLIDSFLNELSLIEHNIVLVIDDYHVIRNPIIHSMMVRFIDYLPSTVRILLASRTDAPLPFAKWRMQQMLTEIGVDKLRFTHEETLRFFEQRNFTYQDAQTLEHLVNMTEGWAAGIRLASLSGETFAVNNSNTNQFNNVHSFITEYLLQEILAALSLEEQDFLVRTSFLIQLEPAICDVLTNRTDSHAVLLELEQKGLFIVRLHSNEPIFRYHHLFQDALTIEMRNRYSQAVIDSLYEEVALILIERGDVFPAIELLLRGELWQLADQLITTYLVDIFTKEYISTFIRWIDLLRSNNYAVHVETLVMYMIALSNRYEMEKARRLVHELQERDKVDHWMTNEEYLGIASIFITAKAFGLYASGADIEQAKELITNQLKNGRVSSRWDFVPMKYNYLEAQTLRTTIGVRGKLWKKEVILPFLELFRQSEFKEQNMTGFGYAVQAETLYEHNDIDEALQELEVALQYGHRFQDPGLYIPMYILKSRIYVSKKKFVEAYSILDYAMDTTKEQHWIDMLCVMKAHCYLLQGNVSQAEWELSKSNGLYDRNAESQQEFWLIVHARLLLAKGQAKEALRTILHLKEKALQDRQVATIVETGVLEAVCQMQLSNEEAALIALHGALKQGEVYNYRRTFLDEARIEPIINKYLKVRRKGTHTHWDFIPTAYIEQFITKNPNDDMLATLKPREKDILKLLADGYSNSDIASQLYLSEGTVRVYLTNIYSKLGVNSRTQAMLIAIEE